MTGTGQSEGRARLVVTSGDFDMLAYCKHYFGSVDSLDERIFKTTAELEAGLAEGFAPDAAIIDLSLAEAHVAFEQCGKVAAVAPSCKIYLLCGSSILVQSLLPEGLAIEAFIEKPFSFDSLMTRLSADLELPATTGLQYTQFRKPESAELKALARLVERDPRNNQNRQLYAFGLYTAGRFKEALEQYALILALGGATFLSLYYMGQACARLNRFQEALQCWQKALGTNPSEDVAANVHRRIEQVKVMAGLGGPS